MKDNQTLIKWLKRFQTKASLSKPTDTKAFDESYTGSNSWWQHVHTVFWGITFAFGLNRLCLNTNCRYLSLWTSMIGWTKRKRDIGIVWISHWNEKYGLQACLTTCLTEMVARMNASFFSDVVLPTRHRYMYHDLLKYVATAWNDNSRVVKVAFI